MGYLPVTLALVALTIIVLLVNLSTIKRKQQALSFAVFSVCQTAINRHKLYRQLNKKALSPNCHDLSNLIKFSKEDAEAVIEMVNSEKISIENSDFEIRNTVEKNRIHHSLSVLNQRQRINIKILERKNREFAQFIKDQPTRMVARLFKYRAINY